MRKLFIGGIGIALLLVGQTLMAQHCYFYSLKYVRVGQENVKPPFAAGMYVTFPASKEGKYICYDSDREGYAVAGSYKLDYVGSNRNAYSYYGWTYWGKAHYNFSADYSLLNVVDEIGNTYVFHRTNGTQPTSTYYSVMDSRANTNGGGTGGTTIIPGNPNSSGISSLSLTFWDCSAPSLSLSAARNLTVSCSVSFTYSTSVSVSYRKSGRNIP